MEDTLRATLLALASDARLAVLILILMEDTLRACIRCKTCFCSCVVLILILMEDTLRALNLTTSTGLVGCLNPYSNGRYSES